ncbi:hypothetical protein [Dongia sp.]|uniref:hypothetical protein n=1 Tax=Dongia sp. TaxID=1977262 RepID=UPI0035B2B774
MFRIMSIATLVLIALCFFIGAGFAFADEGPVMTDREAAPINDASRPVETLYEENLAQNDRQGDVYDFSDYFAQPGTASSTPTVDSEEIEEPDLHSFEKMDC